MGNNQTVSVTVVQGPSVVQARQSQLLPALVNACCFPGLGQLIQGRLLAAIVWWCLHTLAALSMLIGIGFILWPIVWLLCVVDAARYQPQPMMASGGSGVLRAIAAVIALIVVVPVAILAVSASLAVRDAATSAVRSTSDNPGSSGQPLAPETPNDALAASTEALSINPTESGVRSPENADPVRSPNASFGPLEGEDDDASRRPQLSEHATAAGREGQAEAHSINIAEEATWRMWTTADGKYAVQARFVKFVDGRVTLEKRDRTTVDVALEVLCPADHDFVTRAK